MIPQVVTGGLECIGLPASALTAKNKINVLRRVISPRVVESINKGEIQIVEPELAESVVEAIKTVL